MSWIKDNQFVVVLGGVTLVLGAALVFAGLQGSSRYAEAAANYKEASDQAGQFERLPLYPEATNRDGKKKALADYRETVTGLQEEFEKYRPGELENITPQEFTARVIAANNEVKAAFDANGASLPEAFFLGFESYTGTLPRESATGILNYELEAAKEIMVALGNSSPAALLNFHRPRLPEEDGQTWEPGKADVVRPLPLEITFNGSEQSLRNFLGGISKSEKFFTAIRTLRVTNDKQVPPKASDAKFEAAAASAASSAASSDPFGGAFGGGETEAAPEPAAPTSGRILSQVLGEENLTVFLRLDVLQFLPAKDLP